jgi:cytochrome c oxidase subunit 2
MKQIPASILTLIAGVVVTLVSLWVGQNNHLLPEQASEQAPLVDNFFNVMVTIGTALFLVVEGAILLFVLRFRQKPGDDTDGVPIEGSVSLEILWTAIPSILVIGLGIYSVQVYEEMGGFTPAGSTMMAHHHAPAAIAHLPGSAMAAPMSPATEIAEAGEATLESTKKSGVKYGVGAPLDERSKLPDLAVDVTGVQYAWLFNYPGTGITSSELHVPVSKDVLLNISAMDVIHSFWVPQFRLKQDAIPGQPTQLRFVATKIGNYPIVCTELCGAYHGSMRTEIVVQSPEDYESWVAENQIAQHSDLHQSLALHPTEQSASEFLSPYTSEMGIDAATLAHLQKS